MPKYAINIGSTFTPFSYSELVAPLQTATTAYNKLRDEFSELNTLSEVYRDRAEKDPDSLWAKKYFDYAKELQKGADELSKNGYSLNNHNLFSKLKGQYATTVAPIQKGMEREERWVKAVSELSPSERPIVGKLPSLQDFIDNPMARPNIIKGSDVEKNAMDWAKAWSGRFFNDSIGGSEHAAFVRILKTNGINNETISMFMNSPSGKDFIRLILSQYDLSGMGPELLQQVLKEIVSGAMKGFVYLEEVDYQTDPLVLNSLKEGSSVGGSEKTENPLEGIYMEDVTNEAQEKAANEMYNRFSSFVEDGLYKKDFLDFFVSKVTEALSKANQIASLINNNDKEALKQLNKSVYSEEVAQALFDLLKRNKKAGLALLDYEIFSESLNGIIDKTFSGDKMKEASAVYDAVTNRGKLRINTSSLNNNEAMNNFFGNSIKIRGLEELAMNPLAKPRFNKLGVVSMLIKEGNKSQYMSWVKSLLTDNATLHVVKWNPSTKQYEKTGDELTAKDVISDNKEKVKFEPLSIHVIRSQTGEFNAVMKVLVGKEIKTIELPTSSGLMTDNIQNAANAVYDLADLLDPKKSKQAIKNIKLSPIANVYGEDSDVYKALLLIKQRGYLLPEEAAAITLAYGALLTSLKNNISIIGTPGL